MSDVTLPALGESVTEGTVTRWLKAVGDSVAVDEPLVEISTDKVDTEIPSPVAGVVTEILVQEDETVAVGAVLARIGSAGSEPAAPAAPAVAEAPAATEPEPAPAPAPVPSPEPAAPVASAPASVQASAPVAPAPPSPAPAASPTAAVPAMGEQDGPAYVTPIVRKLAQDSGVDLSSVVGTGVGGRIRKEDVLQAAANKPQAAPSVSPAASGASIPVALATAAPPASAEVSGLRGTSVPMSRLRKVIAERAVASMQATAQLTTVVEADVTAVNALRTRVQEEFVRQTGGKLTFLPFFVRAAAEALQSHPVINAMVEGDNIVYPATENISIAVDTERGLLTPVLRDAGSKSIAQIAREIADLAERTRASKIGPEEISGGTFTVTNTGSRGALFDTPVVFLPQVAILGTGTVQKKAVVVTTDGVDAIAVRQMVYLALSYDHRIVDGADAARFLSQVKARLEAADFTSVLGL
jgi:pyruvate dehydrogenase E2 component (dihydrolipoamide acetyltransferase)